ncbi:hypothetical protein BsWGS_08243 [Bradybaena similaris]
MEKEELNVILFGFSFLAVGVLARQFVVARGVSLPVHTFMILAGCFIGIAATILRFELDPLHLKDVSPETPFNIYMCILMFDCAFNTEVHYLKIIAYHMAVVAIPMIVLLYITICIMGHFFLPYSITIPEYIAMMSVIMMPGPHMMKAYLAPTNVLHDLKTLLEGESMFGNYIVYVLFNITTKYSSLPKAAIYVFLDILVGLTVGFLIGKLTILWISNIFKDYVNQTTIVLAVCYGGFAASYLLSGSGFLCVVTIGLVISHRRSSMSTQFVQIINCVMELIVFALTTMTCLSAGIYLMTMIVYEIDYVDIIVTFVIFIIQNLIRGFVLFMGYHFKAKHLETKTNTVTIWACNIRGSYSLMMAFCLHGTGFRANKVTKSIILVLLQIVLSFLANSIVCSYVIGYLNEDTLSKKKWMIERAARLIIAIRRSTVVSLRNAASIADADWNLVVKQTRLKSDFMTAYRYAGWMNKQQVKQMEGRGRRALEPAIDMRNEAIRQISLAEKACYSKLYGTGILTRASVINFMYFVNQCIKGRRLLLPQDIVVTDSSTSLLKKMEDELVIMVNGGPQKLCFRALVVFLVFADMVEIFSAVFFIIVDENFSTKIVIINSHNLLMFLIYVFILLCVIIKNRSFKSTSLWHTLYKVVIVISVFDMMVTIYPVHSQDTLNLIVGEIGRKTFKQFFLSLSIVCVFSRLLRSLLVIQVLPLCQIYLLEFVSHMQSKKAFIECDMATGYIRVITETLRKIHGITTDRALVSELRYLCHKNKLEATQYLAISQLKLPRVVAALKTKTALRLVLNNIDQVLHEMTETGLLAEIDAAIIQKDISLKIMAAQKFPYIVIPSTTRALLFNIPWVDQDDRLLRDLEGKGALIKFYANDIIATQGHLPGGLFIIVSGVVRLESIRRPDDYTFFENEKVLYYSHDLERDSTSSAGQLVLHGFYGRGSIIGELAFLNEKPEHKSYRCATYVETFFISSVDLAEIVDRSPDMSDPLSSLEKKMWRTVAIRQAVRMIHNGTLSSNVSKLAILSRMMDAYIVDGNITTTLAVSPNEVGAVILIQGYVSQFYSELRYVGPCILPNNQQKFLSHPELGPRVIYLLIKSKSVEDSALEGLVPEEPQMADYEDSLTISSGASDVEPYRREKVDVRVRDESDYAQRALASGVTEADLIKVKNYKVRRYCSLSM